MSMVQEGEPLISPCFSFYFCCFKKSLRAHSPLAASSDHLEDAKVADRLVNDSSGYGTIVATDGVVEDTWNDVADRYYCKRLETAEASDDAGDAISKPLGSLAITDQSLEVNGTYAGREGNHSPTPSAGEIKVVGEASSIAMLVSRTGSSASSDKRGDSDATDTNTPGLTANEPVEGVVKKTGAVEMLEADAADVQSWDKGEAAALQKAVRKKAVGASAGGSSGEVSATAQGGAQTEKAVNAPPVPEIKVTADPTLNREYSTSVPNVSTVPSELVRAANLEADGTITASDPEVHTLATREALDLTDPTAEQTKKKKKHKLSFKNIFKKKSKKKLAAQLGEGKSASTPALSQLKRSGSEKSFGSNLSKGSKYSASMLLAAIDDLSDDDVCNE